MRPDLELLQTECDEMNSSAPFEILFSRITGGIDHRQHSVDFSACRSAGLLAEDELVGQQQTPPARIAYPTIAFRRLRALQSTAHLVLELQTLRRPLIEPGEGSKK